MDSPEEAKNISQNNPQLSQVPVVFLSDNEAALEAALRVYNGRALVDSRSQIPLHRLEALVHRWGSTIFLKHFKYLAKQKIPSFRRGFVKQLF